MAAHGSSIAALQSLLTDQSMNGSIASANNATLATVAANYGLKTVVDQHSLRAETPPSRGCQASKADASALTAYALQSTVDTSSEVDSKIAAALPNAVTTAALDAALLGKADASALASLLSTVDGLDTPLEVDTKIANALLGLATEAFVAAQLASRDASITALQASKADHRCAHGRGVGHGERVGGEELRRGDRARARHVAAHHAARRHSAARGREGAVQALAVQRARRGRPSDGQRGALLGRSLPTKNWAGWSKLQVSNNSAAPRQRAGAAAAGNQSAVGRTSARSS